MELKKCSMVLEGGAIKGVFTAGVLDFLMKKGFYTEYVVGVSAGACNALDYVSRQIGRTRDCFMPKGRKEQYLKMSNILRRKPVYDMDLVFDRFPREIYPFDFDTFYASPMKCEMVVTNCVTGKAEYREASPDKEELMLTCRASSSMPLVSPVVMLGDVPFMDGGMADSVPIRRAQQQGYRKHIVVLTKNAGYRKEPNRVINRLSARKYAKYPRLCRTIASRYRRYNRTMEYIEKLEAEGKIFVIRPRMKSISRMEKNRRKMAAFYRDGYRIMEERYEELLAYLEA